MQPTDLSELLTGLALSIGGTSAIVIALSSWIGKLWASSLMAKQTAEHAQDLASLQTKFRQETESYKIKLKKSEFLFQREFDACSEFISLKASYLPRYCHPSMDRYHVCEHMAKNFDMIETTLQSFLIKHGAVLSPSLQKDLNFAIGVAGDEKFELDENEGKSNKEEEAESILEKLESIEKALFQKVHSQSST